MDSTSPAAADGGDGRSGGKILKRRTIASRKTPYDRPTTPMQPENSNWRNGLLYPAKFVAGGATKLLSSIWKPKSWGSRSSSSDGDSDSEVGVEDEDDYVRDENLLDNGAELNQNKGSSSGKSEIMYLIEQLIMLERFSREEGERLIEIINSRVVDYTMGEGIDAAPNNLDISNKAIMEARKVISENMAGTSSKSDLDNSIRGSQSLMTENRDYSGGSWKIQQEMQRLHSKAMELMKPNESISLAALKPGDETVNLAPNDMKNTPDDAPTQTLSSLPTIEEQNQAAEEKDVKDDKTEDEANPAEGNHDLTTTEYAEVADVIDISQGSSNTSDPTSTKPASTRAGVRPSVKRPVTRSRRYNTRRGRARGK